MFQRIVRSARPVSSLARLLGYAVIPLAMLGACSDEAVIMGEDPVDSAPLPLPSNSRCSQNPNIAEDVVALNQDDLAALEGCESIDGSLTVVAFEGADLTPLHMLHTVTGRIDLEGAYYHPENWELASPRPERWLQTLDGLESLEIAGSLLVSGLLSADLEPLHNLRALTSGELSVRLAPELVDLGGLRNLRGIQTLTLSCPKLQSLDGLVLEEDMKEIRFSGSPLTALRPLGVRRLATGLTIDGTRLTNLDAFSDLIAAGILSVDNNSKLENMDGLNGLGAATALSVQSNPRLTRMPEFPNLTRLMTLVVDFNIRLTEISKFPALNFDYLVGDTYLGDTPEGYIYSRPARIELLYNPVLTSFSIPTGWLSGAIVLIGENESLTQVNLERLRSIDYLWIRNNARLETLDIGLLDTVNTLEVTSNAALDASVFDGVRTFESTMTGNAAAP